jgi:hypothetical protein
MIVSFLRSAYASVHAPCGTGKHANVPACKNAVAMENGILVPQKCFRGLNPVALRELPSEKGTTGSEQTASARCRGDFPPATRQNGVNVSTAAWTLVSWRKLSHDSQRK